MLKMFFDIQKSCDEFKSKRLDEKGHYKPIKFMSDYYSNNKPFETTENEDYKDYIIKRVKESSEKYKDIQYSDFINYLRNVYNYINYDSPDFLNDGLAIKIICNSINIYRQLFNHEIGKINYNKQIDYLKNGKYYCLCPSLFYLFTFIIVSFISGRDAEDRFKWLIDEYHVFKRDKKDIYVPVQEMFSFVQRWVMFYDYCFLFNFDKDSTNSNLGSKENRIKDFKEILKHIMTDITIQIDNYTF